MDDRGQFIRRRPTEKYNMDCVVRTVKHPVSVMIWSVISAKGMGRLYVVEVAGPISEGSGDKVAPLAARMVWQSTQGVHARWGTLSYCQKIQNFLTRVNHQSYKRKNVWECLERELAKENITTKTKLIERIIYHWHHNVALKEIPQTCLDSMPRRVAASRAAKGGLTKCFKNYIDLFVFVSIVFVK